MGKRSTTWAIMLLLVAALAPVSRPAGGAVQAQPDLWHTYDSVRFGFSIRYPAGWKAQVVFDNPPGEPYLIRQRISFRSAQQAQVEIDVWDRDPSLPLAHWFQAVENITTTVEMNAVISGQDAYLRVEPGGCGVPVVYAAYVPLGDKVYKIAHPNSGDLAGLAAFDGMVRSFALWAADSETRSQTLLPNYLPASPLTCATNVCPSTCWYGCTFAAIVEGCCGYHPISKWQCAKECIGDQPGTFEGNCVWWAAYTRRDVGELASGDAQYWATTVRNTGQLPVDRTPKVGDTVVHPGASYNHVAYVVWVSADRTSYMMSDMGWCGDCGPTPDETKLRTVDADDEFIHCAGDPAIPTVDWEFTGCPFGWTPSKGFSASELDGDAWGFNPAVDPFLLSPVLAVPADDYNNVELRLFSHAADTVGTIYFTTASSPAFDQAKSVAFGVINDGAWHDIRVNMSHNPNWQGTITRLRVDPVGNGNADGSYDGIGIDRIRFLLFNPILSEHVYLPLVMCGAGCVEVIANGGFETDAAWDLPLTAYPARYSTAESRNGSRSMQVGIVDTAEDEYSYSSAQQWITIPAGVGSASLRFWLYTVSDEPETLASPAIPSFAPQAALADDSQLVLLYNSSGALIWRLWSGRVDDRAWAEVGSFDLSGYAGQTVRLYFGVFNDGDGAATGMYVDEVSLVACPP